MSKYVTEYRYNVSDTIHFINISQLSLAYTIVNRGIHQGKRLKNIVSEKGYTVSDFAKKMGYAGRNMIYELFQREFFKQSVLDQVLAVLQMSEAEFFGNDENILAEPQGKYMAPKPKYIEDRIYELEAQVQRMERLIKELQEKTPH